MTTHELANELRERFRPEAAVGVDMLIRLEVSDREHLLLQIADCTLTVTHGAQTPDVSFRFADLATAVSIIRGQSDAIDAFMNGRFRADGYLMMAFKLMELFGSRSLPPTPND
ncbi:MAG: SCP2 sterol-binding domain-containing protein [Proteobacteria bacterium]|jgi:putative sterol carrier protein|nr:SCP2 sterol-binding domain-containing protein [Pseudomonadota bacterium]